MNKVTLTVPAFMRYLSEWPGFHLTNFEGQVILHKQLPGCGFTEFALTGPENVVLCSPRRMLMENKKDQHGDDVYLVVNEYEPDSDIDEDVSKPEAPATTAKKDQYFMSMLQEQTKNADTLYTRLFNEIGSYITKMNQQGKPVKIIVTYDSTYFVKQILTQMGIIDNFYFCVDEFQSLLEDARFKSSVEMEFLYILQDIKHVCFVSATPMLDKYLVRIPELANLMYYELDWEKEDPTRIKKPALKVRTMKSVSSKMEEIIQTYLDGKFEKVVVDRGGWFEEVESREAVFYVNSVTHIVNIIKKMGLKPEQCNILCSKTPENQRKIDKQLTKKKQGIKFEIGKVPLKGEPHKMFTFCTRTVYLGADFYSTNARSFIFSDSNYDSLSVDISNDLNQILGRERLDENPWKNCAEFYYRVTCNYKKMTQEDLDAIIATKLGKTNDMLQGWSESSTESIKQTYAELYERDAKREKYKYNYCAVNRRADNGLTPILNNLVMINEQRAFDIQQVDYENRFTVFCKINEEFNKDKSILQEFDVLRSFFTQYDSLTKYVDKIHCIVDFIIEFPNLQDTIINNLVDSDKIKQQLVVLGAERIKSLGYNLTQINKAMGITIFDKTTFMDNVYSLFEEGKKYTKKYIKEKLGEIYKAAGFKGTPKATDLGEWYNISPCKIYDSQTKKQDHGFEILSKK